MLVLRYRHLNWLVVSGAGWLFTLGSDACLMLVVVGRVVAKTDNVLTPQLKLGELLCVTQ